LLWNGCFAEPRRRVEVTVDWALTDRRPHCSSDKLWPPSCRPSGWDEAIETRPHSAHARTHARTHSDIGRLVQTATLVFFCFSASYLHYSSHHLSDVKYVSSVSIALGQSSYHNVRQFGQYRDIAPIEQQYRSEIPDLGFRSIYGTSRPPGYRSTCTI